MLKRAGLFAIALLLLIVGAFAVPRLVSSRPGARTEAAPAPRESAAITVNVVRVQPARLTETLATTGTIRANEQVDVVSEITGVVDRIHFREGQAVERDQLLVEIVDTELQAQHDRVFHRVRLAETREARQRELREQGIVSEQEYDLASSELDVLRAELRLVEAQLGKTTILAPFAGVVGLRHISEGSLLSPQTRIASLQDLDPVKVDFTLPERYVGRVRAGNVVEFRIKSEELAREAQVYAVEPRIDPETRSLTIRARAANPGGRLLPGAFADVTLIIVEIADALTVPSLAVIPELDGQKVFVMEEGVAQPRSVETGIRTPTDVQITQGLEPGDVVIVSAIQRLRPGLRVEAMADR